MREPATNVIDHDLLNGSRQIAERLIQKLIVSADIKLGHVAADAPAYSGQLTLNALASGETDVEKMAQFARGKLKAKTAQLKQALTGRLTLTRRFLLNHGAILANYLYSFCDFWYFKHFRPLSCLGTEYSLFGICYFVGIYPF